MRHLRTSILAAATAALAAAPALAHHGWGWTSGRNIQLTGTVVAADLGNPHGALTMEVDGETWTAQVGQPWRNDRAGLTDAMMAPGSRLTLIGERSAYANERLMKAEKVIIDGQDYILYPDRL